MIVVVGSGKLATELLNVLPAKCSTEVIAWASVVQPRASSIVVHAGSGRELDEVIAYCQETGSTLVELATGSDIASRVFGPAPYAEGLAKIIAAIQSHRLENRNYSVMELVEKGWI